MYSYPNQVFPFNPHARCEGECAAGLCTPVHHAALHSAALRPTAVRSAPLHCTLPCPAPLNIRHHLSLEQELTKEVGEDLVNKAVGDCAKRRKDSRYKCTELTMPIFPEAPGLSTPPRSGTQNSATPSKRARAEDSEAGPATGSGQGR